ncbi:MAG TPA: hypothetical protein VGL62_02090 [Vicinamibacterales bacterium]
MTLLTVATLLKLFPVFALAALTLTRRRARWAGIIALALIGTWAYRARADLRMIQSTVPLDSRGAYGLSSLAMGIWHIVGGNRRVSWALAVLLSIGAGFAGWRLARSNTSIDPLASQISDARTVGLMLAWSIYIGSFVAASNYDYRLVFLLPALPSLNDLRQARAGTVSWTAVIGIATILLAMSEVPLTAAFGHTGTGINDIAKIATIGTLTWALTLASSHRVDAQQPIPNSTRRHTHAV